MIKARIALVAAIGKNRELGKNNKLLWHIPEDLARFKKLTLNHPVIMGRKTSESIGHPLPQRTNIVVTRDDKFQAKGCILAHSIEEALKIARRQALNQTSKVISGSWVFIIGGAQIYQQTIDIADRLYLTTIQASFDADTYFPDYSAFNKVLAKETHSSTFNGKTYAYTFLTLER